MVSNMHTNARRDMSERKQHLHNGTILDAYRYRLEAAVSGRKKMIVMNEFSGMLAIHWCFYCK